MSILWCICSKLHVKRRWSKVTIHIYIYMDIYYRYTTDIHAISCNYIIYILYRWTWIFEEPCPLPLKNGRLKKRIWGFPSEECPWMVYSICEASIVPIFARYLWWLTYICFRKVGWIETTNWIPLFDDQQIAIPKIFAIPKKRGATKMVRREALGSAGWDSCDRCVHACKIFSLVEQWSR